MSLGYWVCAAITLVSAGVSLGYAIAGARSAHPQALTASRYALSRSVALFAAAAIALFVGNTGFLAAVAVAMILVQTADAVIGVTIKDRAKTVGPATTALVNAAALVWMLAS